MNKMEIDKTNQEKRFKAVVFDFGGVIEINDGEDILSSVAGMLGLSIEQLKKTYFEHNHLSNVKNMNWVDMLMEVVREFDKTKETEDKVREAVRDHMAKGTTNTELLSFLPKLRSRGFKTAIFSNNTSELRDKLAEMGIVEMFDEVVVSAEIGFQKPHKAAFDVLFEKLGLTPQEVIFIDDSAKSLEKAAEIGYFPIRFESNEQLKSEFKKLGIFV
ncbi:MAG: putative hydrolase of the HAD superfamily [Parcubacteria group bacterium Gr01-1014_20]|nr:MAG: putative hydrolase of the HAD superfamily [Parcubacteria group bacterium Gr01-1014_20]